MNKIGEGLRYKNDFEIFTKMVIAYRFVPIEELDVTIE